MHSSEVWNTYLGLRYDWCRKLERRLGVRSGDFAKLSDALRHFQVHCGLQPTGLMTAATRLAWIAAHPEFGLQLTGEYLEPGRMIFEEKRDYSWTLRVLSQMASWGLDLDAFQPSEPWTGYVWAIRGVVRAENGSWVQTDSAQCFVSEAYGQRMHFSSAKSSYIDTCFVVVWHDGEGRGHAELFEGTCNPGSIWPHGTAHLSMGQYFYKLGRHRTRERDHIRAVEAYQGIWPAHWVTDRTEDSVQYYALESVSPIEVIRSTGDCLDLSSEDIRRAEVGIAHRDAVYVDPHRIKINIHTCALDHASSLGCMNVVPTQYGAFMAIWERLAAAQRVDYGFVLDIPFYLCDASMLKIGGC